MIFGTEVRIISQTYSEATQLMPTITWAKKSSSKSTYIGTIKKLKISTPFEVLVVIRLKYPPIWADSEERSAVQAGFHL